MFLFCFCFAFVLFCFCLVLSCFVFVLFCFVLFCFVFVLFLFCFCFVPFCFGPFVSFADRLEKSGTGPISRLFAHSGPGGNRSALGGSARVRTSSPPREREGPLTRPVPPNRPELCPRSRSRFRSCSRLHGNFRLRESCKPHYTVTYMLEVIR